MKIETKLDLDANGWFMQDNKPACRPVRKIVFQAHTDGVCSGKFTQYSFDKYEGESARSQLSDMIVKPEGEVFVTKQELLDSL